MLVESPFPPIELWDWCAQHPIFCEDARRRSKRIFPAFVVNIEIVLLLPSLQSFMTQKEIKTLPLYLMTWRSNSSRNTWRLKTQIKLSMNLRWMTYMMRTSVFVWLKWCASFINHSYRFLSAYRLGLTGKAAEILNVQCASRTALTDLAACQSVHTVNQKHRGKNSVWQILVWQPKNLYRPKLDVLLVCNMRFASVEAVLCVRKVADNLS